MRIRSKGAALALCARRSLQAGPLANAYYEGITGSAIIIPYAFHVRAFQESRLMCARRFKRDVVHETVEAPFDDAAFELRQILT